MKPMCEVCGTAHEKYQGHLFPRVSRVTPVVADVAKAVSNAPQEAINTARQREAGAINAVVDGRTPNRRARADYNEYMRGYMAKRRAAGRVTGGAT